MAKRPNWKLPSLPIGKKGPRRRYKKNLGKPWSPADVRELKGLAKQNTPTGVLSPGCPSKERLPLWVIHVVSTALQ